MIYSKKIILISFVFLGLFALFSLNSVQAISAGTLGIRPTNPDPTQPFGKSWFIYTAETGKEIKDQVDVINLADVPVRVKIWAADAATTEDGAYTIKEESKDIGTWITFFKKSDKEPEEIVELGSEVTVDLKANETKIIDFVLKVSENAEVGDHMGAIMVQAIGTLAEFEKGEAEIGAGVKIVTRVGARVYLTVPGEIVRKMEFTDFSWEMNNDKFYFLLTLENKGNVRIEPKGEIIIKNILGRKEEIKIPTRVVFPKDKIVLPVEWERPSVGRFIVLATAIYSSEILTREITFWILHSQGILLGIGLSIGIILILLVRFLIIRKNKKKNEKEKKNL